MLLATSNKSIQLLMLSYVGVVRREELARHQTEIMALMGELSPGFRVLADFSRLEDMEPECVGELGKMMEEVDKAGVGMVVRVIADPRKDPGMNILTIFHYRKHLQVVTCEDILEALKVLAL
jgi:hypothetical protein